MCKLERVESPSERNSFSENEWNSFLLQMEQSLNVDARSVDQGTRFRRSSNERYIVKSAMYLYFWQKRVCNYKIGLRTWNYWYEVSRFCQSVIMHNSVLIFGWDIYISIYNFNPYFVISRTFKAQTFHMFKHINLYLFDIEYINYIAAIKQLYIFKGINNL